MNLHQLDTLPEILSELQKIRSLLEAMNKQETTHDSN